MTRIEMKHQVGGCLQPLEEEQKTSYWNSLATEIVAPRMQA
jgi:hypothetical protein